VDTNAEVLREEDHANTAVLPPDHTIDSLERLYEEWSATRFDTTVLEVAKQAIDGKQTSDQLLERVDGYLALVALKSEELPPGEAYNQAREAVKAQIGKISLLSEDQAIEEIIDMAAKAASQSKPLVEPPQDVTLDTGPRLEGIPLRVAIINFLTSLPDGVLDKGNYRSAGSVIVDKLTPFGHSDKAIRSAVKKLVDDGLITQTRLEAKSPIVDSLQVAKDAQERLREGKEINRRNYSNKNDRVFDFMYKDKDGKRISVDLNRAEFMALPIRDRFLIVAAKFQNLRFMNGSVYESVLKATNIKKDEDAAEIELEDLVLIDEHSVKLTEIGETVLLKIEGVTSLFNIAKKTQLSNQKARESGAKTEGESISRADPETAKLLQDFKQFLLKRGAGIMPNDDESVTKQFNDICINELGTSPDLAAKLYNGLKNDPQILKLSFKSGGRNVVQYVGLVELQDDPITRAHIMVGDLRSMVDSYDSALIQRGLAFDEKIQTYRALCERMTRKDWEECPYEDLELYSGRLLAAMREVAQSRRRLRVRGYDF